MSKAIFVFGSNLAGRHGKGAAREAYINWGAPYYYAEGLLGDSYAIPTKDKDLKPLPLEEIQDYVTDFIGCAKENDDLLFILTPIGCGLAGYTPEDIAPMFKDAPSNVYLPKEFIPFL